jgi:FKBP-type peptidyl-prolyl cis-trans isomerase (trigger factor)
MGITQEEITEEIRRMRREYNKEWRRKNPERVKAIARAALERRAIKSIMKRRESEQSDAGNE